MAGEGKSSDWFYKNGVFNVPVIEQMVHEVADQTSAIIGKAVDAKLVGSLRYAGRGNDIDCVLVVSNYSLVEAKRIFIEKLDANEERVITYEVSSANLS